MFSNIFKKKLFQKFALLLAQCTFESKLVNFFRQRECLNIRENSKTVIFSFGNGDLSIHNYSSKNDSVCSASNDRSILTQKVPKEAFRYGLPTSFFKLSAIKSPGDLPNKSKWQFKKKYIKSVGTVGKKQCTIVKNNIFQVATELEESLLQCWQISKYMPQKIFAKTGGDL